MYHWFYDDHRIYLVLEYAAKGELYQHLLSSPNKRFNEHVTAKYIYQKPENLLLSINDEIILANFGCSVHSASLQLRTIYGTVNYFPPEMVEDQVYGKHVDNWCLGVLCYKFLVGNLPFDSQTYEETFSKISNVAIKYSFHVSAGAINFISKLLVHESAERLSLDEASVDFVQQVNSYASFLSLLLYFHVFIHFHYSCNKLIV